MKPEELYSQSINRVSDINKTIFNYRILYITVLGAIFTGISFIVGVTNSTNTLIAAAYSIPFMQAICLTGVAVASIIAFFDMQHQSFIENCIDTIVDIERSNVFSDEKLRPIFSQHSPVGDRREITAYRFNFAISLLYFVPILTISLFQFFIHGIIVNERPFENLSGFAQQACFKANEYITIPSEFNKNFDECYFSIINFQFRNIEKTASFACLILSIWAAITVFCYGLKRVLYHRRRHHGDQSEHYLDKFETQFSSYMKISLAMIVISIAIAHTR